MFAGAALAPIGGRRHPLCLNDLSHLGQRRHDLPLQPFGQVNRRRFTLRIQLDNRAGGPCLPD
jgi:hypothetical protein